MRDFLIPELDHAVVCQTSSGVRVSEPGKECKPRQPIFNLPPVPSTASEMDEKRVPENAALGHAAYNDGAAVSKSLCIGLETRKRRGNGRAS
jgi:hypothetical protein